MCPQKLLQLILYASIFIDYLNIYDVRGIAASIVELKLIDAKYTCSLRWLFQFLAVDGVFVEQAFLRGFRPNYIRRIREWLDLSYLEEACLHPDLVLLCFLLGWCIP